MEVLDITGGLLLGVVLGTGLTVLLLRRKWCRSPVLPVPADMPPLEDVLRAEFRHHGSVAPGLSPLPELVKLHPIGDVAPEGDDKLQPSDAASIQIEAAFDEPAESHSVEMPCKSSQEPTLRPQSPQPVPETEQLQQPPNCHRINLFSAPAPALPEAWQGHKVSHAVASTSPGCLTLPDLRISGPKDLLRSLLPVVLPLSRYDPRPLPPLALPRLDAPCWPKPCFRFQVSALQTRWEPGLLEPASNPIPPGPEVVKVAPRKWHGPITSTMKGPWWSKSTAARSMRWVSRGAHPGPGLYDAELTNIFGRIPGTRPGFPSQSRLTRSKSDARP